MYLEKREIYKSTKALSTIFSKNIRCSNNFFVILQRRKKIGKEVKNDR
jgi:hypothetical protein